MNALDELLKAPNLRELLDEGERAWNEEQKRRHAFWAEADEGVEAEFILGEIIYHSPLYGRHWMASTNISTELLPYVKKNKLGKVGYEKVMIRLTRNDYDRTADAAGHLLLECRNSRQLRGKTIRVPNPGFHRRNPVR